MASLDAAQIHLRVTFAWWWPAYFQTLLFVCAVTGLVPDTQKFHRMLVRAVRFDVVKAP